VVALLLPVVLEAPRVNTLGTFFQGRYCLPMSAAAVLILATRPSVADVLEGAAERVRRAVGVLWFAGQAGAFLVAWHRYAVGSDGPLLPGHPAWQPPGGYVNRGTVRRLRGPDRRPDRCPRARRAAGPRPRRDARITRCPDG